MRRAYWKLAGAVLALTSCSGHRPAAPAPAPLDVAIPDLARLREYGDLRVQTWSIHGLSPLVVLFTEAPPDAPEAERLYRRQLTRSLFSQLELQRFSLFALNAGMSGRDLGTEEAARRTREGLELLRKLPIQYQPQAYIGFAEGGTLAILESLQARMQGGIIALAPSLSADRGEWEAAWQRLGAERALRAVLIIESACNSGVPWAGGSRYRMNETVLLLPGYEPWLRRAWSPDCAKGPPDRVDIDSGVYWLIIDWLTRNVRFPI